MKVNSFQQRNKENSRIKTNLSFMLLKIELVPTSDHKAYQNKALFLEKRSSIDLFLVVFCMRLAQSIQQADLESAEKKNENLSQTN